MINYGLIKLIRTRQLCVGIHFPQLGKAAIKALLNVKNKNGCIITCNTHASVMTDIVDIDRFHIGSVKNELTSKIMGIPINSGYYTKKF